MRIVLGGKEVASVSRGVAVGSYYAEEKGFAVFFNEDGEVYSELVFEDSADMVSCDESVCAIYSGGFVHLASMGAVLKKFKVEEAASWIYVKGNKVFVTHDEGITAYSLEGTKLWKLPYGPVKGVAEVKGRLFAGTYQGMIAVSPKDGKVLKEIDLGEGFWKVTSSCGSAVLAVNEEDAKAVTFLAIKDVGEPEPVGEVSNVVGVPWISPDCLYVAVPKCGVAVHDAEGHEVFSDSLEGSDECVGVWSFWDEELLVGVADEGLWTSYILFYKYPFGRSN